MVERVTIGDTEVEIRETEDGFEAVEVDDFEAYVEEGHTGSSFYDYEVVQPSSEGTKFSDCDVALRMNGNDYASRKEMQALEDDERIRLCWAGMEDGSFEIGLADREKDSGRYL